MPPVESLRPDHSMRHWIAHDLRFWREKAGLSQAELGAKIHVTKAWVSNVEHARDGWNLKEDQAEIVDELFGLSGHFRRLVRLSKVRDVESLFTEHLEVEATADEISSFDLGLIPGLLQTERYARKVLLEALSEQPEVDVKIRMERQKLLTRQRPPLFGFVLDESALRRQILEADGMREQLRHLISIAELPHVSIQVVPQAAGWHPGVVSSFKIMDVSGTVRVYTETIGRGSMITSLDRVREFQRAFKRISTKALSTSDTLRLMGSILKEVRDDDMA